MEARNAFDIHEAMSLLADDGATAGAVPEPERPGLVLGAAEPSQLALALEAERMFGVRYEDVGCRLNGGGGSADVTCTYAMDSKLRRLAGLRPVESAARFRIGDGRIDLLSFPWLNVSWNPRGYFPKEAERFVLWLFAHYPEAIDAGDAQAVRIFALPVAGPRMDPQVEPCFVGPPRGLARGVRALRRATDQRT